MITHWDEVEGNRRERGHIAASWQALTGYNSITAGVQRISVEPGRWATPLHLEGSEEEIFYVLSGTGFSVQVGTATRSGCSPVGPGDCLVHLALEHAHTIGAGDDELVVLAFGQRHYAANTLLPRAGVSWLGPTWVLEGAPEDHPWAREAAVGPPTWDRARRAARAHRQPRRRVRPNEHQGQPCGYVVAGPRPTPPARSGRGSRTTSCQPGKLMNPPHVHSAEEEIFVVLEGSGTLQLYPSPRVGGESSRSSRSAPGARSRGPPARGGRTGSRRATTG